MDLDKPVLYRGFDFNTVTMLGNGKRKGCLLEEADFSNVQGVGYTEKRAQGDGLDASDVYLGGRIVSMRGTIYGDTRADAYDRLQDLRSALTPTAAYADEPTLKGYLPLEWSVPTELLADFPSGWKEQMVYARPRAQPQWSIRRDQGAGGEHLLGGAISWNCVLECKDPRIYLVTPVWTYFTASKSGVLHNKGDYPAPIDILLDVTGSGAGSFALQVAGANLTITIPAGGPRVLRYSSTLGGILTMDTGGVVDVLRMDLLNSDANFNRPFVAEGDNPYTITYSGPALTANTRLMYNEAFA